MEKTFTTPNGREFKKEDLDDILSNCDATSNYWIDELNQKSGSYWFEQVVDGDGIQIKHGSEEGEEFIEHLTEEKLLKGIDTFIEKYPEWAKSDNDTLVCNADCDNILQYSLFGSLIYG